MTVVYVSLVCQRFPPSTGPNGNANLHVSVPAGWEVENGSIVVENTSLGYSGTVNFCGVALTGSVQRTLVEMDESFHVMRDAGGGKWISLAFTDKGAAAKAKGIKAGSQVKATCQKVLGSADKYIMVGECSLS